MTANRRARLIVLALRVVLGSVGVALIAGALFFLADPINIGAYYLGYGEEIRVEVTAGTDLLGPGGRGHSEPGTGRVIGEHRTVGIYDVDTGEVVTARPRLIDLGARPYVYHGNASVLTGLTSFIPVVLLGVLGFALSLCLAPAWLLKRLEPALDKLAAVSQKLTARMPKNSANKQPPRR